MTLLFIHQRIGVVTISQPGIYPLSVHPQTDTGELFWLRRVIVEPVR